jgi:hypothetical protein
VLARADLATRQRAEALCLVATCCRRLGEAARADAAITAFDRIAGAIQASDWTRREIDAVREGEPPSAERAVASKPLGDLATEIWTVRQHNATGKWAEAAALAEQILASNAVQRNEQRGDLWLHVAHARHRLGQRDTAEAAFAAFAEIAASLPADSRLADEMILLREALELPPLPRVVSRRTPFVPPAHDTYWTLAGPTDALLPAASIARLQELAAASGADGFLVAREGPHRHRTVVPRQRRHGGAERRRPPQRQQQAREGKQPDRKRDARQRTRRYA